VETASQKAAGGCTPTTRCQHMTAIENTSVGRPKADAPTAVQSTHFDARDRLEGHLDDATVRQAVQVPVSSPEVPAVDRAPTACGEKQ